MKYDFSTYLKQVLNEAKDENKKVNVFDTDEASKTKTFALTNKDSIEDWIEKNYKNITLKKDNLIYTSPENNEEYTLKSKFNIKKMYNEIKESSGDKAKALNKDGFELLGKTIAYRSALTVWNIINNSGDDFKQAALDVFKDNSEYSIKQLENLDSLLDYSAAIGVVKDKKNRLDKNDANYEALLKKCNDTEAKLTAKENYTTIQQIKKDYEKEFNDKRDVYEKAFNDGMAEQKKDMQDKDYKWKDPATGQPPKGKLAKSNQAADAIFKSIQSGVEKADEFAKKQQGLDKAILSLAVMGVKGMMFGGKMLKKLLTGFLKKTNLKDILRYTAKFNDVKDKIIVFKKEYDEWKKYNDAQQKKKEKTDEEKKEEENRKKTISMKLTELMNTHVIPYYYCKLAIVVACFENLEGKYIIKQENNKWSTYNSGSGRLTIIEDNAILMERILEVVNEQLVKKGVFETLKDESSADAFKGIPKDLKYKKDYADKLLKWKDKIKSVSTVSKFNKDNLKNILNVYNEKVIVNSFASYDEFAKYVPTAQGLVKQHDIPVAKEIVIKFDGDEDSGIPGIITGAKKEAEEKEENNGVDKEQISKEYKEISAALDELKNVNELEKVNDTFTDINSKVNNTIDQLKGIVDKDKETDEEKKKKLEDLLLSKTTIDKVIAIKAVMKNYKLESVAMNEIIKLLNEDAEVTPDVEKIKNEISEIIGGDITLDNASEFTKKSEKVYNEIEGLYKNQNNDTKKNLEKYKDKPLQLLYAIGAIKGEKKEEKKPDAPADAKKDAELLGKMFAALGDHLKDTDLMKLITTVEEQNKKLTKDLQNYLDEPGVQTQFKEYVNKLGKYSNQILPAYWAKKTIIGLHESFWYNKRLLALLNEAENEGEEKTAETQQTENKDDLTKKTEFLFDKSLEELCNCVNVSDFLPKYEKWVENVNNLVEEIKKANNEEINKKLDELKNDDPLKLAAACARAIETLGGKKENPEEKKTEETPKEEGSAKSEESEEIKKS